MTTYLDSEDEVTPLQNTPLAINQKSRLQEIILRAERLKVRQQDH